MAANLRDVEKMLKYAADTDPFRVPNSSKCKVTSLEFLLIACTYYIFICVMNYVDSANRRRVTAVEAQAQLNGKGKVHLWLSSDDDVINNSNRRGSAQNSSGNQRGGNNRGGGGAAMTSKRYHARMDAGMLSDDEEDSDRHGSYTQSCSSQESVNG